MLFWPPICPSYPPPFQATPRTWLPLPQPAKSDLPSYDACTTRLKLAPAATACGRVAWPPSPPAPWTATAPRPSSPSAGSSVRRQCTCQWLEVAAARPGRLVAEFQGKMMICLTQTRAIFSTACTCITQPPVSPTVAHLEIHKSQKAIGAMLSVTTSAEAVETKSQKAIGAARCAKTQTPPRLRMEPSIDAVAQRGRGLTLGGLLGTARTTPRSITTGGEAE